MALFQSCGHMYAICFWIIQLYICIYILQAFATGMNPKTRIFVIILALVVPVSQSQWVFLNGTLFDAWNKVKQTLL